MSVLYDSTIPDSSRIRALKSLNLISDHLLQTSNRKDYKCMQVLTTRMSEKGFVQNPYRKKSHWYYTYGVLGSLGENMNDGVCEVLVIPAKIRWLDFFPVVSKSFFFKTKVMIMVELGKELHISNLLLNDQKVIQFVNYTRKFRKLFILMLESMQPYQNTDLTLSDLDLVFQEYVEVQTGLAELTQMNKIHGYPEDKSDIFFSRERYDRFHRHKRDSLGCKMTVYEQTIMSYMKLSNVGPIDNAYIMISLQAYDTKIRKKTRNIFLTASEFYTEIRLYYNNPEKVLAAHLESITLEVIKQGFLSQIEASLRENNGIFNTACVWVTRTAAEYESDRFLSTSMISSSAWAIDSVVLLCLYIPAFLRFVKFIRSQYLKLRVLMSSTTIEVQDTKGNMQKVARSLTANLWSLMKQNWKDLDKKITTWAQEVLDFVCFKKKSGETMVGFSHRKAKTVFKCTKFIYRMNEVVLGICVWSGHVESQFDLLRACFEYGLGSRGVDPSNGEFHADILDKLNNINSIQRFVLYGVSQLLESISCASKKIGLGTSNSLTSMFLNQNLAYVGSSALVLVAPVVYEFVSDRFSNNPTLEGSIITETINSVLDQCRILKNIAMADAEKIFRLSEEVTDSRLRTAEMNLEVLSLNSQISDLHGTVNRVQLQLIDSSEQMSKAALMLGDFISHQKCMGDFNLYENVRLLRELQNGNGSTEPVIDPSLSEVEMHENRNRGNIFNRFEEIQDIVLGMTNVEYMHQQGLMDIILSLYFVNIILSYCCIIQKMNHNTTNYFAILRVMKANQLKIEAIRMDTEDILDISREDAIPITDEVKKYMFVKIGAFTSCKVNKFHNQNIKNYSSEIEQVNEIEDLLIDEEFKFVFQDFIPSVLTHDCSLVNINVLFKMVNTMFFDFDFLKDPLVCTIMKTEAMIHGDDYVHKDEPSDDDFGEILRSNIEDLVTIQNKTMEEKYEQKLKMRINRMKKNRNLAILVKDRLLSYDDSIDTIKQSLNLLDCDSDKIYDVFLEMIREQIKLAKTSEAKNILFEKAKVLLAKQLDRNDVKIKCYSSLFKTHKKNRESRDNLTRKLTKFENNLHFGIYKKGVK